jgi:hypothetical protein
MAFAASVQKVLGFNAVRFSTLTLNAGTAGIIGLFGDAGADVNLPASFPAFPPPGLLMSDVVALAFVTTDLGAAAGHYHVTKTDAPFRITITNDAVNPMSIEGYVIYLHSLFR